MRHLIEIVLGCVVAAFYAAAFFWGRLPKRLQRALTLACAAAGLVACLVALGAGGDREAAIRTLLYRHHYVVANALAPSNLLPLVLGAAFLAAAAASLFARGSPHVARGLTYVVAIALLMTALRFAVDVAAASEPVAHAFGILWMAPALGANSTLLQPGESRRAWIVKAAYLSRLPAILATVLATHFRLGTHYSLASIERIELPFVDARFLCSPLDGTQWLLAIAIPQLVLWPLLTIIVAATVGAHGCVPGVELQRRR